MTELSFGDKIRRLREVNDLTLMKLAKEVKISTSMLGKIEKNNRRPTAQLIIRFSKYFGVSEKELTVAFLSDTVVYEVLEDKSFAMDVLKAAEKKVKYLKVKSSTNQ